MERILLLIIIILPVILTILFFIRSRKAEGYIEESLIKRVENKDRFIEELKKLCAKKKWDVQFLEDNILIKTNTSIYSFGEIISIIFMDKDDGLYMKVSSKPKVKATRIDYNKNKKNVELISGLS
ncbi:MAG: hypothetical protein P1P82_01685 [Bacteroidales bacterium]|nr:hypothetical protein [Bacteroidales bacterium]MDT8430256.1 hypothetical protein [Bacteroidales bacterium]